MSSTGTPREEARDSPRLANSIFPVEFQRVAAAKVSFAGENNCDCVIDLRWAEASRRKHLLSSADLERDDHLGATSFEKSHCFKKMFCFRMSWLVRWRNRSFCRQPFPFSKWRQRMCFWGRRWLTTLHFAKITTRINQKFNRANNCSTFLTMVAPQQSWVSWFWWLTGFVST